MHPSFVWYRRITVVVGCALVCVGLARGFSTNQRALANLPDRATALLSAPPLVGTGTPTAQRLAAAPDAAGVFLPVVAGPPPAPTATATATATSEPLPAGWLARVNAYRAHAGVPPVTQDAVLNANCFEHARYMAENNHLTHNQNPSLPWASPAGQICAGKGNAWLGGGSGWTESDAIDGWMGSIGHRLWLLYPTTPTFGFGFYTNGQHTGAALDVLSTARLGTDSTYQGWPVRYPAIAQPDIPPAIFPITLQWPYFDDAPAFTSSSLRVLGGAALAHTATTSLPAGHKGIAVTPTQPLPAGATLEVTIAGSYKGQPFTLTWTFSTR